jgi:DNA-binding NarL/FixJ family response regulator
MKRIREIAIGLVDDHTLLRKGLASLLEEFEQINILFDAENGEDMQQKMKQTGPPEVILMDVNMPKMDGVASVKWLKAHHPAVSVIALSMLDDEATVIKMLKAGAGGYMLKESRPQDLVYAIEQISIHGFFATGMASENLIKQSQLVMPQGGDSPSTQAGLSEKEEEFLLLMCTELSLKEVADKMCISPRTTENYRERLQIKLGVKNRIGMVLYAIRSGLYKLD